MELKRIVRLRLNVYTFNLKPSTLIAHTSPTSAAKPFIIENVPGSPLRDYIKLHGTMFGLKTNKERWFELHGFEILLLPARYSSTKGMVKSGEFVGIMQHSKYPNERYRKDELAAGYEIEWELTRHELRQAIPPVYTEYIGKYLIEAVRRNYESNQGINQEH